MLNSFANVETQNFASPGHPLVMFNNGDDCIIIGYSELQACIKVRAGAPRN